MGRGRSGIGGSGGSGGGGGATGELILPDGSKIEFDGTLVTGGKDASLTQAQRANVEAWENKRAKAKIEYGFSVDKDGNPIGKEAKGGKGSVRVPHIFHDTEDAVFTHIHPRGDGVLGGTFSSADLSNFANYKNKTVRAVAKEGTYSISKGKNFDRSGFNAYVSQVESAFNAEKARSRQRIDSAIRKGTLSYGDVNYAIAKDFNTALVNMHSAYLAWQKKYGYTYTLEPR